MKPQGNGIAFLHDGEKENGFCCMKLIKFLSDEGITDYNEWHNAHQLAARGECQFRSRCPIYKKSKKE